MTSDFLDRLDAVIEQRCSCGCGTPVDDRSPSAYFASEDCAARWHQPRIPVLVPAGLVDLTVFGEAMLRMSATFAQAVRPFFEQMRPHLEQLVRVVVEFEQRGKPPTHPLGRVVWLRRTRNTGPRPRLRSCGRVDPPGGFRVDARGRPTYRPVR